MSTGLTPAGFVPKRLAEIKADLEAAWRVAFGANVRVDADTPDGQIIGIFAERFADLWEQAEKVYASAYPGGAEDSALDDLVALAAIVRRAASYSDVVLTLSGTPSTLIPAGSSADDPVTQTLWTTLTDATIGGGGSITVHARPSSTGPVRGLAGTIIEIKTPITGWASVTNAADATLGRDLESNAQLRQRFALSMRAGGSSAEAIRAALLRIDQVTEALVIENLLNYPDADGRPPHSFEAVVRNGDDQTIIDTIWALKPAGIEAYGNTSGTAVDSLGDAHSIAFSRPVAVPIYFVVEYSVTPDYPVDIEDQMLLAILDHGTTLNVGSEVIPIQFIQAIETAGLLTLTLFVGTAPSPPASDPIPIDRRHLATFDSTRISFSRV